MHMKAIQACAPGSPIFLEANHIPPLADSYGLNKSAFPMECSLAKHTLSGKHVDEVIDVLCELSPLRTAFPVLVKSLQIALNCSKYCTL